MTNEIVTDAPARRAALDPSRSFCVEAAAGAGKTTLLTQRLLALLLGVDHPEEIVAITFTRKAAAEMRERVLEALRSSPPAADASEHAHALHRAAQAVLAVDAERGWQLLQEPSRLRILTIDALVAMLVRRWPLQAGLSPMVRIRNDAATLYARAARRLLLLAEEPADEPWQTTVRAWIAAHDNDWQGLENQVAALLAHRERWLPEISTLPTLRQFEERIRALQAAYVARLATRCPPPLSTALSTYASALGTALTATPDPDLCDFSFNHASLGAWQKLADALLTKDGKPRVRAPTSTVCGGPPAAVQALSALHKPTSDLLALSAEWRAEFAAVREVPSLDDVPLEYARVVEVSACLRLAAAQWRLVSEEEAGVDYSELALAAVQALGATDRPNDAALALDYQWKHLLVDEFQDTSRLQYTLLERMTAGWNGDDGRTMFMVGDPWQSIYRFRDADANLFANLITARRFGNVPLSHVRLNANFRTRPRILQWINEHFARAVAGGCTLPFAPFAAVRADELTGEVTLHRCAGDVWVERVIDIVKSTWARRPGASIAVLVRGRAHLGRLPQALSDAGIALTANEVDPLYGVPVVNDLMALTAALYDLTDRVAWLAVLRAPWCGFTPRDLLCVADGPREMPLWHWVQDSACTAALDTDTRLRLTRLRAVLKNALVLRGRVGYARLVDETWHALHGPQCLVDPSHRRYAEHYFALLNTMEREDYALNGPALAAYISAHFGELPRRTGPAVELMTIHRAKGLEFDIVIVPELQRAMRAEERPLLRTDVSSDGLALFAAAPPRGGPKSALYEYLHANANDAANAEAYRLLYVALTRARDALHLLWREPARQRQGTFFRMLQASLQMAPAHLDDHVTTRSPQVAGGMRLRSDALALALPDPAAPTPFDELLFEWASVLAKPIGTVTHAILQALAETPEPRALPPIAAITIRLRALGLTRNEAGTAAQSVHRALSRTLSSPRGQWILSVTHQEARNEYRVCVADARRVHDVVIDRTFIADGIRWIIDYKTGGHEGGDLAAFMDSEVTRYRAQLDYYARVFSLLDPRPIRLGLYFPRLDGWREWPANSAGT